MLDSKRIKDLLPDEVERRKKVLSNITAVFEKHGYKQIITPAFEQYEVLNKGLPRELENVTFRFFDYSGTLMALRPDITTQVSRVVATTMADKKGPIRLYYSGDVYRAKKLAIGQEKQFHQVGIELFDMNMEKADKEVLKIVKEVLKKLGLKNFEITQTNVSEIQKLKEAERKAIFRQDFVSLDRIPEKSELLSVDMEYYTGLYFECYVPEVGYVLGSGGRYDNLVSSFGKSRNAVGFAFDLHHLMTAMTEQKLI